MAILFYFSDGTTTATISSYVLAPNSDGGYGYTINASSDGSNVEDNVRIAVSGQSTGRTLVATLNRVFEAARFRARTGTGPRVFVYFKVDTGDVEYRSELYNGRVVPDPETAGTDKASDQLHADIYFTRAPWWEGAETQVPINYAAVAGVTTALALNNDAISLSTANYFVAQGSAVTGDLPSPARLELTNTTSATTLTYIVVGQFQNIGTWIDGKGFLQGEAQSTGGSDTSSASASGGSYAALTVPTSETFGTMTWSIPGADVAITDGRPVLPLMRFHAMPPSVVYLKLAVVGASTDYTAVDTSKQWVLFPPIPLPPHRSGGPYQAHTLSMDTRNSTGGTVALQVDYVSLIPADNVRQYVNLNMANSTVLVDDGIEGYTYVSSSGNRITQHVAYGQPFMLWPGLNHTFWVHFSSSANTMLPAHTMSAKLYHRPRRATI